MDVQFTYYVSHPAISPPIKIESHIERSEESLKWSIVHMLEMDYSDLGWDWVEEMDNMVIHNRSSQEENNCHKEAI